VAGGRDGSTCGASLAAQGVARCGSPGQFTHGDFMVMLLGFEWGFHIVWEILRDVLWRFMLGYG